MTVLVKKLSMAKKKLAHCAVICIPMSGNKKDEKKRRWIYANQVDTQYSSFVLSFIGLWRIKTIS
jgi:S-methylmethionine-dependent homocysteine/selenocysteine methylase